MRYEAPATIDAAISLLASAGGTAKVLAGGSDLIVQMRSGRLAPDLVVDLKRIPALTSFTVENGGYRVGAAKPCMELIENEAFACDCPGVIDGIKLIGSIQVKGRCSIGGNLCNASPAADSVPALIAGRARARVIGPNGGREMPVEDIAIGPGKTSLGKAEIVESFHIPKHTARCGSAYLRFTPRSEMDIAVVSAAVNLTLDETGMCTDARVVLGAVAERALLVPEAAKALIGTRVDDGALDALAAAASTAARPIDDKRGTREYRIKVAGVLAKRAARIALDRAGRMN